MTRLGSAGSYCTGSVIILTLAASRPLRPLAKPISELTELSSESVVIALVAVSARPYSLVGLLKHADALDLARSAP